VAVELQEAHLGDARQQDGHEDAVDPDLAQKGDRRQQQDDLGRSIGDDRRADPDRRDGEDDLGDRARQQRRGVRADQPHAVEHASRGNLCLGDHAAKQQDGGILPCEDDGVAIRQDRGEFLVRAELLAEPCLEDRLCEDTHHDCAQHGDRAGVAHRGEHQRRGGRLAPCLVQIRGDRLDAAGDLRTEALPMPDELAGEAVDRVEDRPEEDVQQQVIAEVVRHARQRIGERPRAGGCHGPDGRARDHAWRKSRARHDDGDLGDAIQRVEAVDREATDDEGDEGVFHRQHEGQQRRDEVGRALQHLVDVHLDHAMAREVQRTEGAAEEELCEEDRLADDDDAGPEEVLFRNVEPAHRVDEASTDQQHEQREHAGDADAVGQRTLQALVVVGRDRLGQLTQHGLLHGGPQRRDEPVGELREKDEHAVEHGPEFGEQDGDGDEADHHREDHAHPVGAREQQHLRGQTPRAGLAGERCGLLVAHGAMRIGRTLFDESSASPRSDGDCREMDRPNRTSESVEKEESVRRRGLLWKVPLLAMVWAGALTVSWSDGAYLVDLVTHLAVHAAIGLLLLTLILAICRRWIMAGSVLAAAGLIVLSVIARSSGVTSVDRAAGHGSTLRVVSYNCASEQVASDEAFVAWLAGQDADLVALIEAPRELASWWDPALQRFPHRVGPVRGKMWSMWLLSRHPLEIVELEEPTPETRFVYAVRRSALITLPSGRQVLFGAGHPPSPRRAATWRRALSWAAAAGGAIDRYAERTGTPIILATDVNAAPWGRVSRLLASEGGLASARPLLGGGTFPAWAPALLGIPIDTVWTRGCRSEAFTVGPRCGSDHRPVRVDVRIGGPEG
jgi:endonuclease/exonuclease/phosphatase (EEP) superfamily protein YafD